MNYEKFSPEAKQAIEHIRKFLNANKNNVEKPNSRWPEIIISDTRYMLGTIIYNSAISFLCTRKEAIEIEEFCNSKHYWLD